MLKNVELQKSISNSVVTILDRVIRNKHNSAIFNSDGSWDDTSGKFSGMSWGGENKVILHFVKESLSSIVAKQELQLSSLNNRDIQISSLVNNDESVSIEIIDPKQNSNNLNLIVFNNHIKILLATDNLGLIISTVQDIIDLINTNSNSNVLVSASLMPDSTSSNVVDSLVTKLQLSLCYDSINKVIDSEFPTCIESGLSITTNIGKLIENDIDIVIADPVEPKYIKIIVGVDDINSDIEIFSLEKTTGTYGLLPIGKTKLIDLKEFSLVANGTDLVEINNFIV